MCSSDFSGTIVVGVEGDGYGSYIFYLEWVLILYFVLFPWVWIQIALYGRRMGEEASSRFNNLLFIKELVGI